MQVTALDGRTVDVGRRWAPWRLRTPGFQAVRDANPLDLVSRSRDAGALVFDLVVAAIRVLVVGGGLVVGFVFLALQVLVFVLVVPVVTVLRLIGVLPWVVEARSGDQVLGTGRARGWHDSEELVREMAADVQFGRHVGSGSAQPITRSW